MSLNRGGDVIARLLRQEAAEAAKKATSEADAKEFVRQGLKSSAREAARSQNCEKSDATNPENNVAKANVKSPLDTLPNQASPQNIPALNEEDCP